jgi:preprotein translocase subunit SecE
MASESQSRIAVAMRELFSLDVYKRTQGKLLRALTAAGVGLFTLWGLLALSAHLRAEGEGIWVAYAIPAALGGLAAWIVFRIVNWPRFADFLIATEAEMSKVSWSSWPELKRATQVVLVTLFLLALFLLGVDVVWSRMLQMIGVLRLGEEAPASKEQSLLNWESLQAGCNYVASRWS